MSPRPIVIAEIAKFVAANPNQQEKKIRSRSCLVVIDNSFGKPQTEILVRPISGTDTVQLAIRWTPRIEFAHSARQRLIDYLDSITMGSAVDRHPVIVVPPPPDVKYAYYGISKSFVYIPRTANELLQNHYETCVDELRDFQDTHHDSFIVFLASQGFSLKTSVRR